jgi:hypothetical protein
MLRSGDNDLPCAKTSYFKYADVDDNPQVSAPGPCILGLFRRFHAERGRLRSSEHQVSGSEISNESRVVAPPRVLPLEDTSKLKYQRFLVASSCISSVFSAYLREHDSGTLLGSTSAGVGHEDLDRLVFKLKLNYSLVGLQD